jgi:hypothetical protein
MPMPENPPLARPTSKTAKKAATRKVGSENMRVRGLT